MGEEPGAWEAATDAADEAVEGVVPGFVPPPPPSLRLPSVTELVSSTAQDVMGDFGGYMLSGLLFFVVMMGGTLASVLFIYGGMFLGMVPGMILEDEGLTILGVVSAMLLATLAIVAGFTVLLGPLLAGLIRSLWARMNRGQPLTLMAPLSGARQDPMGAIVLYTVVTLASVVGMLFCYLPGLLVQMFLGFALPAHAVHGLKPMDAMRFSIGHVRANLGWHLAFYFLGLAVMMVIMYIPFIGYVLMFPVFFTYQLKAYREIFGDCAVPVGWEG